MESSLHLLAGKMRSGDEENRKMIESSATIEDDQVGGEIEVSDVIFSSNVEPETVELEEVVPNSPEVIQEVVEKEMVESGSSVPAQVSQAIVNSDSVPQASAKSVLARPSRGDEYEAVEEVQEFDTPVPKMNGKRAKPMSSGVTTVIQEFFYAQWSVPRDPEPVPKITKEPTVRVENLGHKMRKNAYTRAKFLKDDHSAGTMLTNMMDIPEKIRPEF